MVDPLTVNEDALAKRSVTLAAGRGDAMAVMSARHRSDGRGRVTTEAMMAADGGDGRHVMVVTTMMGRALRGHDLVATMMAGRFRRCGDDGVMMTTPMLHRRGDGGRRLGVVSMVTMDRSGRRGRRYGMMVAPMMRRGGVRAARDGSDEGQRGHDAQAKRRSHTLS